MHPNKILLDWKSLPQAYINRHLSNESLKRNKLSVLDTMDNYLNNKFISSNKVSKRKYKYDIYIISLRRSNRLDNLDNLYNLYKPYKKFDGIDGLSSDFNYKDHKYNFNIEPNHFGHAGCTLSHLYLAEKLAKSKKDFFVIFEDDSVFFKFSDDVLKNIISNIDNEMDIIYLSSRCSEKIYASADFIQNKWCNFPDKQIYTMAEVAKIMSDNKINLPKSKKNNRPYTLNGNDGYILTKKGASKLLKFLNSQSYKHKPFGAGHNIDTITTKMSLSTKTNYFNYKDNNLINTSAILKSYISRFPVSGIAQNFGINTKSDIQNK